MLAVNHDWIAIDIFNIVVVIKRNHSIFHTDVMQVFVLLLVEGFISKWAAADCYVIKQTARATIRSVHRTQKSPAFR
jgi:hypothetical protein